jgi:fumarate reductase flavoprotein subunit
MGVVKPADGVRFDAETGVLVVGAGAAGLIAALRAREAGADVLVLERDALPQGSTALSAGLIPAAGTRFQAAAGVSDSVDLFAADIMAKAHGEPDPAAVEHVTRAVGPALEWLAEWHGLPFSVIDNFTYPGHSGYRMHGLPSRSGAELMDRLRAAAEVASVDIVTEAPVTALFADQDGTVRGAEITRPDGGIDSIGCEAIILACNGYGGSKAMVADLVPEMAGALYFGHPGNQGDAIAWGRALGARMRHLSGYQGHGSVAHPHGILITWATITEGGFQVNRQGVRFADESRGYSEQAAAVNAQPEGLAVTIFDERIARIARQFEDFRQAEAQGAIVVAGSMVELAHALRLPADQVVAAASVVDRMKVSGGQDGFGRNWSGVAALEPPFRAVQVTGALFHTQGGLVVDAEGRVVKEGGGAFPNLFAAGGAACGVSGSRASGYLSGNGLLTAVAYGYLSGHRAGLMCKSR